jgi:hypothetical protein
VPPNQAFAFSGSSDTPLGAIRLPTASVLRWTNGEPGSRFAISAGGAGPIDIASTAAHGEARIDAGVKVDVTVRATGRWTIVIVPAR